MRAPGFGRGLVASTIVLGVGLVGVGCGGGGPDGSRAAPSSTEPTGTVVIREQPGPARGTAVKYLRIERSDGEKVRESEFADRPRQLRESLAPGEYRVLAWSRRCGATCRGDDLGSPDVICGAPFTLVAGTTVTFEIVLADEGCTIRSSP